MADCGNGFAGFGEGFDDLNGWTIRLDEAKAAITSPICKAAKAMAPYVRLEWRASGLPASAQPYLEWTTEQQPEFSPERRVYFSPIQAADDGACGNIACSGWFTKTGIPSASDTEHCFAHEDLTSGRCEGMGGCPPKPLCA